MKFWLVVVYLGLGVSAATLSWKESMRTCGRALPVLHIFDGLSWPAATMLRAYTTPEVYYHCEKK